MSKKGQSLLGLSKAVKCSRDAIWMRRDRWELEPPYFIEQFADRQPEWKLKPIDGRQADALSLEEARTELTVEQTEKVRKENRKMDGELIEWEPILQLVNPTLENIMAIIRRSNMPEAEKQQCADEVRDLFAAMRE